MTDTHIKCPNCQHQFALTDTLAEPIIESLKSQHQKDLAKKDAEISQQAEAMLADREKLETEKRAFSNKVNDAINDRLTLIRTEERERAKKQVERDIKKQNQDKQDLQDRFSQLQKQLETADKNEAAIIKERREMESERRAMGRTIESKISSGLAQELEKVRQEEKLGFDLERRTFEVKQKSMEKQIADLQKSLQQGSQQTQGEVLELELEDTLHIEFPYDKIEPVRKGVKGGDIIQTVRSPNGSDCGKILWEAKRAKNWSGSWIPKLKQDQRNCKADLGIILSTVTPKEIIGWGEIDNVWITGVKDSITLARALRNQLIAVNQNKIIRDGQSTNAERIYDYLMGPLFKARVQSTLEKTKALRDGLTQEKRAAHKHWSAREQQIQIIEESMSGMAGDLFGIAGSSMSEIEALEPLLLDDALQDENDKTV